MEKRINSNTRRELIRVLGKRYRQSVKSEKGKILDEFIKITNYHRKHAIRLLNQQLPHSQTITERHSRKIYDTAVREALIVIWEAADRICGKRLRVVIPEFVESLQRHGHITLDSELKEKLFAISAASIDRLLSPVRLAARGRSKNRCKKKPYLKDAVPIRTFADWNEPIPGNFEMDFVAHNGGSTSGSCVHSLVLTDVSSGWTECIALVAREQSLVVEALKVLKDQLPVPLLGIDTDNDSAFINDTLIRYCKTNGINLTRSRAYLKNDQAWIEQKNGSVVRRFTGYQRFSGILSAQVLGHLHQVTRLYVNFFQPSFKLREKTREGAKVRKTYFPPATPCDRLLKNEKVDGAAKSKLLELKKTLDPVRLLHTIRELQGTLSALSSSNQHQVSNSPPSKSLSEFLEQLPRLWQEGEVRATHRRSSSSSRYWRTRKDPFKQVWPELLDWLQCNPDITAKELFEKLKSKYPTDYYDGQLRTLQRRVKGWRQAMARELIGLSVDNM